MHNSKLCNRMISAHINVWTHRNNGPHFTFEGSQKNGVPNHKEIFEQMSYLDDEVIKDFKKMVSLLRLYQNKNTI